MDFWDRVDKSGECWLWTGRTHEFGYGNVGGRGRAHRIAWELENGPVPDGLWVLHHCDEPKCVRPAHLFLGTQSDNTKDMWAKGRGVLPPPRRGAANNQTRLTEDQVREIRRREGESVSALAREFNVSRRAIDFVIARRNWRHI